MNNGRKALLQELRKYTREERWQKIHEVASNRTNLVQVVIEDIYQEHNAGALIRTCDCFGIQQVHVIENYYKTRIANSISKGSEKWIDVKKYEAPNTNNTIAAINHLKSKGFEIVATTPHHFDFELPDFKITQPTAIIFGTEGKGLTQEALQIADKKVRIPIYGFTESYNISVSAALTLQHVVNELRNSNINWQLTEKERINLEINWLVKSMGKTGKAIERKFN